MKLTTLAIAIAAASVSFSAQAKPDLKFSGDFHVGHKSTDSSNFGEIGSEFQMQISEKGYGGLRYFAHVEIDFDDVDAIEADEIYIGVAGGFGQFRAGELDNACDKLEVGGDWNEFQAASDSVGDCSSTDYGTLLYTKKMGKAEFGVSHNVDSDENSAAVRYKHSKNLQLGLGFVQYKGAQKDVLSASITAKRGPFGLKARVNNHETKHQEKNSDGDLVDLKQVGIDDIGYSVFLGYHVTKNDQFNIGTNSLETVSVGYNRKLSSSLKLFAEAKREHEGDTETGIGVQYKF